MRIKSNWIYESFVGLYILNIEDITSYHKYIKNRDIRVI